ncbi:class III extradiol ring-cleavage dioxygenase [Chitinibacter sp. ZOR0017]|uniref:DODA-type extradiol aromatic ring-opening family dioxygenase n=1 Tax=Chitinibacter sp. ZOR0017 TaxID=1339254 RepID=UPI000647CDA4|nr:class III extradiol ring-cleavage dioxygenase [Chitinibacter sp. ZOR0017]
MFTHSSLFISHGAPSTVIDDIPARHFLAGLGARLPRPRAIVLISAHNIARQTVVGTAAQWQEWHDFSGFAPELYQLQYRPQGAPALAMQIAQGLAAAGMPVAVSDDPALDHGAWVPLKLIYPLADVPVVTVSLAFPLDNLHHWQLGEQLAALLPPDVLLVTSGSITHNLRDAFARMSPTATAGSTEYTLEQYAAEFIADTYAALNTQGKDGWLQWEQQLRHARRAHPSIEHFLPLLIARAAAGTQQAAPQVQPLHQSMVLGVLGMDVIGFNLPPMAQ